MIAGVQGRGDARTSSCQSVESEEEICYENLEETDLCHQEAGNLGSEFPGHEPLSGQ